MTTPLHLIRIPVELSQLARYAHDRNRGAIRLKRRDGREREAGVDEGRTLHHLLDETFGPAVLRPFRLMTAPGKSAASIYGYAAQSKEQLQATARETSLPEAGSILALERMDGREVASTWTAGRHLGFDIRIRPVVRIKMPLPNPRQPAKPYQSGAELDAFFVEAQRNHPGEEPATGNGTASTPGMTAAGRTREAVYRDWLAARLTGATLIAETTVLERYERTLVSRVGHAPEGPDAVLHGELEITDPAAFQARLAQGIGRHKAYGFDMLMLRPVRLRSGG